MLNNEWNLFSKRINVESKFIPKENAAVIYIHIYWAKKKASCNQQVKVLAVGKLSVGLGSWNIGIIRLWAAKCISINERTAR